MSFWIPYLLIPISAMSDEPGSENLKKSNFVSIMLSNETHPQVAILIRLTPILAYRFLTRLFSFYHKISSWVQSWPLLEALFWKIRRNLRCITIFFSQNLFLNNIQFISYLKITFSYLKMLIILAKFIKFLLPASPRFFPLQKNKFCVLSKYLVFLSKLWKNTLKKKIYFTRAF
jgi:hypothetical protein